MGILFNFFFSFILATAGLLFAILAYNLRRQVFFYLGLACILITAINIIRYYDYFFFSITSGDLVSIALQIAWILTIVFLVLSRIKPKRTDDGVTDAFLDDIINAEDEEWDPES